MPTQLFLQLVQAVFLPLFPFPAFGVCVLGTLLDRSFQLLSWSQGAALGLFFAISACVGEPLKSQGLGGFGDSVGLIEYRVQYGVCWRGLPAGGLSAEPLLAQLMRVGRGPGFDLGPMA